MTNHFRQLQVHKCSVTPGEASLNYEDEYNQSNLRDTRQTKRNHKKIWEDLVAQKVEKGWRPALVFLNLSKYNLTRQQHCCSHGHKLNDVHCINNQQLEISCKHYKLDICLFHPLVWFHCLHSCLSYFTSVSIRNKSVNWQELLVLTITVAWMPKKALNDFW